MSNSSAEKIKSLTAAQRIEQLEQMMAMVEVAIKQLANSQTSLAQSIKILNDKIDAMVTASSSGQQITHELLSDIMMENNVLELKAKLQEALDSGQLVPAETLDKDGFFVGREIDSKTGNVVNKRVQMLVSSLVPDVREKLIGKKVGDVIKFGEDKLDLEIEEVYRAVLTRQAGEQTQKDASS